MFHVKHWAAMRRYVVLEAAVLRTDVRVAIRAECNGLRGLTTTPHARGNRRYRPSR